MRFVCELSDWALIEWVDWTRLALDQAQAVRKALPANTAAVAFLSAVLLLTVEAVECAVSTKNLQKTGFSPIVSEFSRA